jgi:hypothetical protein
MQAGTEAGLGGDVVAAAAVGMKVATKLFAAYGADSWDPVSD